MTSRPGPVEFETPINLFILPPVEHHATSSTRASPRVQRREAPLFAGLPVRRRFPFRRRRLTNPIGPLPEPLPAALRSSHRIPSMTGPAAPRRSRSPPIAGDPASKKRVATSHLAWSSQRLRRAIDPRRSDPRSVSDARHGSPPPHDPQMPGGPVGPPPCRDRPACALPRCRPSPPSPCPSLAAVVRIADRLLSLSTRVGRLSNSSHVAYVR